MEKNKFTHGSLFSGIGGPEIAAEEIVLIAEPTKNFSWLLLH